jgi:hypothetical protein
LLRRRRSLSKKQLSIDLLPAGPHGRPTPDRIVDGCV